MVRIPVKIQVKSINPGEPTCLATPAVTIKMPLPIIEPMTIIVESNNVSERFKSVSKFIIKAVTIAVRGHK